MSSMKDQYTITINGFRFVIDLKNGVMPYFKDAFETPPHQAELYHKSLVEAMVSWHRFKSVHEMGSMVTAEDEWDQPHLDHFIDHIASSRAEGWNPIDVVWQDFERIVYKKAGYAKNYKPGYVYLLQSPTKAYKIGRTSDPDNRIKTFSVKLPFEVAYLALIKTNNMHALEGMLHRLFGYQRIDGEWFDLSSRDVEYIKSLAVAS